MRSDLQKPPTILQNVRNFFNALLELFSRFGPESPRARQHHEFQQMDDANLRDAS